MESIDQSRMSNPNHRIAHSTKRHSANASDEPSPGCLDFPKTHQFKAIPKCTKIAIDSGLPAKERSDVRGYETSNFLVAQRLTCGSTTQISKWAGRSIQAAPTAMERRKPGSLKCRRQNWLKGAVSDNSNGKSLGVRKKRASQKC